MKDYKTSFKEGHTYSLDNSLCEVSKMKVYRTKCGYKCTVTGSLNAKLEPWTDSGYEIAKKIAKKFPGVTVCANGSVYIEATSFSKCHPEDRFVDKKGQRIAESRCKTKIFKRSQKVLNTILSIKKRELEELEEAVNGYQKLIDTESKHIEAVESWKED